MFTRRHFIVTSSALAATPAMAALDPKDADIKFGTTGSIFGVWNKNGDMIKSANMRMMLMDIKHYGLEGFEPYSDQAAPWYNKPQELKKLAKEIGVEIASVGDLPIKPGTPPAPKPAPGAAPNYAWLGGEGKKKLIADMEACARDFLQPLGVDHWKNNMGPRPPGYDTNDEQIKVCADALNQIGEQIIKMGVRLAPHPHVNSLVQTDHETHLLMKLTDPKYVWLTADTAHLTLGGMDPVAIIKEFWPRVTEIHYKDAPRHLRGSKVVAVPRTGDDAGGHGWFRNLNDKDGGGVDFPTIQKFLVAQNFKGWVVLDLDTSMIPKGSNMEEVLKGNIKYMVDVLNVDPKTV